MTNKRWWVVGCIAGALAAWALLDRDTAIPAADPGDLRIPLAVLGDSDSHAYHDSLFFPDGSEARGGRYHAVTFQWTEVLARLRGEQIDLGDWGIWGTHWIESEVRSLAGPPARSPRKQDFRYNFAVSGATCQNLLNGRHRQAARLVEVMDADASRWRRGVIVVRIGINDLGIESTLDELARSPDAPEADQRIEHCIGHVRAAVQLIRERHRETRILLVGVLDNLDWPRFMARWQSAVEGARITRGLDRYDRALREIAAGDPHIAYFDDRAWFAQHWGGRDAEGRPDYRAVTLGDGSRVEPTEGDAPQHMVLADGHAGVVWNALWAQRLVQTLRSEFGLALEPIRDDEVLTFLAPLLRSSH